MIKQSLLFILIFCSCKSTQEFTSPIAIQHQNWRISFDSALRMNPYYTDNAALYINDEIYQGKDLINEELKNFRNKIKGIKYLGSIKLVKHDSLRFFDVGLFKDKSKAYHAYLIAWNKVDDLWKKELEIIQPYNKSSKLNEQEINVAREQWVQLSNSHNHRALIEQSYTENAIYFNNGKVDNGTEAIVARYAYMSDLTWKIELTPIQLLPVQEDLVYEIGEYKSGGVGHYFILWAKDKEGVWKVRLDFNF